MHPEVEVSERRCEAGGCWGWSMRTSRGSGDPALGRAVTWEGVLQNQEG